MHLDRLIQVLEAVAIAGKPVSPAEVQRVTRIPRPTCYRLLQTLASYRLLDQLGDVARYQVGDRLKRIALLGQSDADVCLATASTLQEAAIEFGEAVFLSRFRSKTVEIINVKTPVDAARSFIHPGLGNRPLHACSCSKAIAAFADPKFQEEILSKPLRAYTEQTKTHAIDIEREFSRIRDLGYAECVEEIEVGVASVAAPIRIGDLGVPFSVGATGPIRRFTSSYRKKIGAGLMEISQQIAANLQLAHLSSSDLANSRQGWQGYDISALTGIEK
ncbi:MAG: helix-turn-helix domain-containing protein [Gammaproteobacteria bacterium]|jgi:DNA-binding IclR family transcriptional regulator|nr:helix-turn-helix domain-containing protein [Gammaproteobacteria bacterium]